MHQPGLASPRPPLSYPALSSSTLASPDSVSLTQTSSYPALPRTVFLPVYHDLPCRTPALSCSVSPCSDLPQPYPALYFTLTSTFSAYTYIQVHAHTSTKSEVLGHCTLHRRLNIAGGGQAAPYYKSKVRAGGRESQI